VRSAKIMGAMADELDKLYEIKPAEFTSLRTKLAATAKQRGDNDTAKQISAACKPTTAAWVVNRLALPGPGHHDAARRARRAAQGCPTLRWTATGIRAIVRRAARLVDDVARAAFEEAELADRPPRARRRHGNLAGAIATRTSRLAWQVDKGPSSGPAWRVR
jgi:hypothetical protein